MPELVFTSHDDQHLDEFAARWFTEVFAVPEEHFPDGIVPAFGTDFTIFDEHLPLSEGGGRMEKECATTLVAKFLGVFDDPRLKALLKFILNTDRRQSQNPFDLAAIILMFRRLNFGTEEQRYEWLKMALDAFWLVVRDATTAEEAETALSTARAYNGSDYTTVLTDCGLKSEMGGHAEKMWDLFRRVLDSGQQGYNHPWDVIAVTRIVEKQFGAGEARRWLEKAVNAVRLAQLQFLDALDILKKDFRLTRVPYNGRFLIVTYGEADNPLMAQAARSKGAAIVIHRLPCGQVLISTNQSIVPNEVAHRVYESLCYLSAEVGDPKNTWYPHKNDGGEYAGILNGGKSHPEKPPTKASTPRIVEVITSAILSLNKS